MKNPKLTSVEEAIMLAVLDQPRYGQAIVEVVSAASQGYYQIGCGTLYPALRRLKNKGLIQTRQVDEDLDVRNGHSRCYYQVTQKGRETLIKIEEIRDQIKNQDSVPQLLT